MGTRLENGHMQEERREIRPSDHVAKSEDADGQMKTGGLETIRNYYSRKRKRRTREGRLQRFWEGPRCRTCRGGGKQTYRNLPKSEGKLGRRISSLTSRFQDRKRVVQWPGKFQGKSVRPSKKKKNPKLHLKEARWSFARSVPPRLNQ